MVNILVNHAVFYKSGDKGNDKYYAVQFLCDVLNEFECGNRAPVYDQKQIRSETTLPHVLSKIFEGEIKSNFSISINSIVIYVFTPSNILFRLKSLRRLCSEKIT